MTQSKRDALVALREAVERGDIVKGVPSPKKGPRAHGYTVAIMAWSGEYAMVRHKGAMPFVTTRKELLSALIAQEGE